MKDDQKFNTVLQDEYKLYAICFMEKFGSSIDVARVTRTLKSVNVSIYTPEQNKNVDISYRVER